MKVITKKKADEILKRITANEIIGIEYIKDIEGWHKSIGANRELGYAMAKDMIIMYE